MRAFAYIGDEGETDAFGFRFPRGMPVSIDETRHAIAVKKLSANQWFREVIEVEDAVIVSETTSAAVERIEDAVMQFESVSHPGVVTASVLVSPMRRKPGPKPKQKAE